MGNKKPISDKKQGERKVAEANSERIAIIRISGMVKVPKHIENTLYRLRLRRKYSCVVVNLNKETKGTVPFR